jgi:hypothetical protein
VALQYHLPFGGKNINQSDIMLASAEAMKAASTSQFNCLKKKFKTIKAIKRTIATDRTAFIDVDLMRTDLEQASFVLLII